MLLLKLKGAVAVVRCTKIISIDKLMGPEDPANRKKIPIIFFKANFLEIARPFQNVSLSIGSTSPQKLGPFFSIFLKKKNNFQCSKVVSEATFPTNKGYVSIEKWS